jgi:hypothetical protein
LAYGRRHWHIDHLLALSRTCLVLPVPDGDECALVHALCALPLFQVAAAGFGNSDCRRCRSHLLRLCETASAARALDALRLLLSGGCGPLAFGRLGERFVVIEQDPFGGTVEILELTALQRPHEGGKARQTQEQGDWHEIDEDVQGRFSCWIERDMRP